MSEKMTAPVKKSVPAAILDAMTEQEQANIEHVRAYLAAIAGGNTGDRGDVMGRFFAPDAIQIELPNRLNPNGGESDLAALRKRSEQGAKLLRGQTYEIRSALAHGDQVAVEAFWTGTLAVGFGTLEPGSVMKAHFAMFFEFKEGRIFRQRNYDCFEPW
jgi:ketosteroid isomerase-like protein